jgi:hypothetical protein
MMYVFYDYLIEIPAYVPRERFKGRLRRRLKKAAIYAASTSELILPIKYSKYTDVFFEGEINNIPSITRTNHVINFEKNSIIFYEFIYHFSERKLIILR